MVTHTAWLNRSSILYAGEDKWSVDPRVSLVALNQDEFTIKIENVDMTDEGQYVCAVQTSSRPTTTSVHLIVQGNTQSSVHSIKKHRGQILKDMCCFVLFYPQILFSFLAPLRHKGLMPCSWGKRVDCFSLTLLCEVNGE